MSSVFNFKSKRQLDSLANLNRFIFKCRYELEVFGGDLNWEAPVWYKVGTFTKLGTCPRKIKSSDLLDIKFIEFAKAYFRYQQGHKPTSTKNEKYFNT